MRTVARAERTAARIPGYVPPTPLERSAPVIGALAILAAVIVVAVGAAWWIAAITGAVGLVALLLSRR